MNQRSNTKNGHGFTYQDSAHWQSLRRTEHQECMNMKKQKSLTAAMCIFTWFILLVGASHGQTPAATNTAIDHCGSSFTEAFVPEQMFGCNMAEACKAHDICYGKCDPSGSKEGSDYCKQSEISAERVAAKQACDKQFFWEIAKTNGNKWQCRAIGGFYTAAVVIAGQGPFNGKPMSPQTMKSLIETSTTPEEATAKFNALALEAKAGHLDLSKLQREGTLITLPDLQASPAKSGISLKFKQGASSEEIAQAMANWRRRQSAAPLIFRKIESTNGATK